MKETRLRSISPLSLANNLALLFFCSGVVGSILAGTFYLFGPEASLGGPVQFTPAASGSGIVLFLNPLLVAAYGYLTGLLAGWFYNLVAERTGGLVYYLEGGEEDLCGQALFHERTLKCMKQNPTPLPFYYDSNQHEI